MNLLRQYQTQKSICCSDRFKIKKKGVAIIYITHKMDEIRRIADEITIIRDGSWVSSGPIEEYKEDDIISLMVGRENLKHFPKRKVLIGDVVMEVKGLTSRGVFRDIDFKGPCRRDPGILRSGWRWTFEVMRAIFGLDPYESERLC